MRRQRRRVVRWRQWGEGGGCDVGDGTVAAAAVGRRRVDRAAARCMGRLRAAPALFNEETKLMGHRETKWKWRRKYAEYFFWVLGIHL